MASNQYGYYDVGDRPGGYGVIPNIWAAYGINLGGQPGQNREPFGGWQNRHHHQQRDNVERGGPPQNHPRANYYGGGGGSNNRRPTSGPRAWTRGGHGWAQVSRSRRSPMRFGQQPDDVGRRGTSRNNITIVDSGEERRQAGQDRRQDLDRERQLQGGRNNSQIYTRGQHDLYQQQLFRDRRTQPPVGNAAPPLLPTPPPAQHQQPQTLAGANQPQPSRQFHQTQWHGRGQSFGRPRGGSQARSGVTDPAMRPWANEHGDVDLRQRFVPVAGLQLGGISDFDSSDDDDDDNYMYLGYDSEDGMLEDLDDLEVLSMLLEHDCPPEHLAARLAEEAQRRQQLRQSQAAEAQPSAQPPAAAEKMGEKLPANWEPADDKSHRERLTDELLKGTCECVICFEQIKPAEGIWNCFKCFHIFHVTCIRKWALAQINPINVLLLDRTWRCPSCRDSKRRIPHNNYCFCGKTRNPDARACGMPHSCGYECGRRRRQKQPSCAHPCPMTCHPGPCPPCLLTLTRHCPCSKTSRVVKCCDGDLLSCNQSCDKLLSCGQHRCKELCHPNPCPPCDQLLLQECYCGRGSRVLGCSEAAGELIDSPYRCVAVCNRLLPCKMCRCPKLCHDGRCALECHRHPSGSSAIEVGTDSLLYTEPGQCTIL